MGGQTSINNTKPGTKSLWFSRPFGEVTVLSVRNLDWAQLNFPVDLGQKEIFHTTTLRYCVICSVINVPLGWHISKE